MRSTNRRAFLRDSVLAAAGLTLLGCGNNGPAEETTTKVEMTAPALPYLDTIGIQLWTVRDQMAIDPRTTLKTLADLGYYQVEAGDTRVLDDIVPICKEYGLKLNSTFIRWNTITGGWQYTPDDSTPFAYEEVLESATKHGLSHLVFGYLMPQERETADDWKRLADQLNEAGDQAKSAGLKLTYHNHNFEWDPVEGTTGFDILKERMDGNLVPFELDVFWAQIAGQDARTVLEGIKDRTELLHLKQLHPGTPIVTRIPDVPQNAYEELPDGDMPIKDLMRYGREIGVKYCMVEQDGNYEVSSLKSAEKSIQFLMDV